jgi:hypothetical protein
MNNLVIFNKTSNIFLYLSLALTMLPTFYNYFFFFFIKFQTDTASVLYEAIQYIKYLQEQVQVIY